MTRSLPAILRPVQQSGSQVAKRNTYLHYWNEIRGTKEDRPYGKVAVMPFMYFCQAEHSSPTYEYVGNHERSE